MAKISFEAPVIKKFIPAGNQPDYESAEQWVVKNYESPKWKGSWKGSEGIKERRICLTTKLSNRKQVTLLMEIQADNKIIFKEKEEIS